jgi:hypothetical protein
MEKHRAPHSRPLTKRPKAGTAGLVFRTWARVTPNVLPARPTAVATAAAVTAVAAITTVTAATAAEAATTTAAAAATTRTAAFTTLVRGVHSKRSPVEHLTIHGVGRRLGLAFGRVFDESEPARPACFTIDDH